MKKEYIQPRCKVRNVRPHCMLDTSPTTVTVSYRGDDEVYSDDKGIDVE